MKSIRPGIAGQHPKKIFGVREKSLLTRHGKSASVRCDWLR